MCGATAAGPGARGGGSAAPVPQRGPVAPAGAPVSPYPLSLVLALPPHPPCERAGPGSAFADPGRRARGRAGRAPTTLVRFRPHPHPAKELSWRVARNADALVRRAPLGPGAWITRALVAAARAGTRGALGLRQG